MFNEDEDVDENEDKITYKESIIQDTRNKLLKNGDKLIKKGLYYVEEMKELTESQQKNIKEKLIKFQNELIRKNKINNRIKRDLNNYNGIKDIRYLFNEYEDECKDIRYLFNEKEDADEGKRTYKDSPLKSIIQGIRNKFSKNGDKLIKNGLYYVEEMKSLGSAEIRNIKKILIISKYQLIRKNRIKKDLDDYKDIRYLFNEEDIYNAINDIKYLFNENEDKDIKRDAYYADKKKRKLKQHTKNLHLNQ